MTFAICNEIYQNWPLARAMEHARRTGYDGIEIAPFTLGGPVTTQDAAARAELRAAAARAGIAITGIHWVLVGTEGLHLTDPDPAVRGRTADYLRELVDFCADVGGRAMVVGSPKQRNLAPGVTPEQGWQWAQAAFGPAVTRAEQRGVTLCFEPLSPSETNFINTAAEGVRFARAFGSPAMKIILDVKAMCSEDRPVADTIRATAREDVGYFHANDRNLKGPGFGEVDFVPIFQALDGIGYDGVVSVEVFRFEEGPEAIAEGSLRALRAARAAASGAR
jgi:sugar phosphate isomerase/epimerase